MKVIRQCDLVLVAEIETEHSAITAMATVGSFAVTSGRWKRILALSFADRFFINRT